MSQLDLERIIHTIRTLRDRIQERFPGSGLGGIAGQLLDIATQSADRLAWVARPHLPLRIAAGVLIALILALLAGLLMSANLSPEVRQLSEFLQALESGLNDVFLIGAVIFFLLTAESRIKRRKALRFIRELRALAHIVDMHQLTKDPDRLDRSREDTPSSPQPAMSRFALARYLDYCSELLSLNSKLAALYAQHFDDPVVLAAVDEVEGLSTGFSGKIWQKIMILNQIGDDPLPSGDGSGVLPSGGERTRGATRE